jgi:hypothetical protein
MPSRTSSSPRRRVSGPSFHPRSIELHGFARRKMAMEFELGRDFYRPRSVTEGFFGGLANRYPSRTRCRLLSTTVSTLLLMVVAHNLRILARVQAMNGQEIFILLWIYSINPPRFNFNKKRGLEKDD